MKHTLLLLFTLPFFSFGQCPPDGIFTTQEQIDAFAIDFPDCTQIDFLNISGGDITDLTPLLGLTNLLSLHIHDTTSLTDLDGVQNLVDSPTWYGPFVNLTDNTLLSDISALSNLIGDEYFHGGIIIRGNPILSSLDGLQGFSDVLEFVFIEDNDSLTSLNGLNNIIGADDYVIEGNDALTNLEGLGTFTLGALELYNNDSLESLDGFNVDGGGGIVIIGNESLIDISALEDVVFYATGNTDVSVGILNNSNLEVCNYTAICEALFDQGYVLISNNAQGCNTVFEVAEQCGTSYNNDCNNYQTPEITLGEPIQANTNYATQSPQVPSCNDEDREDVWFRFNSGGLESINITVTTGFSIQLWDGYCGNLTLVPSACAIGELLNIPVTTNNEYYLQVWQYPNNRTALQGDFELLVTDESLSVAANTIEAISLYPNPTNGLVTLKGLPTDSLNSIEIYSILGKHVGDYSNRSIDISTLENGVYFIKIVTDSRTVTKRIIKK